MRQITYRCFNKKEKKMYPVLGLYFGSDLSDFGFPPNTALKAPNNYGVVVYLPAPDIPVMESTEWKDKDGTDIFEGDILEGMGSRFLVERVNEREVCFNGLFLRDISPNRSGFTSVTDAWLSRASKVIGNIYENPELL